MSLRNYLPTQEADFVVWFENFSKKLPSYATTLNIDVAEITDFQATYTNSNKALNDINALRNTLQSSVASKNDLFAIAHKKIRDKAVILKRHPNYTEAIGEDLGIVPPAAGLAKSVNLDIQKPTFSATVMPDMVRLDWVKSEFDGVLVQCKRGAETIFTNLDKDTASPYEDQRKNINPELHEPRTYRMRYLLKDREVGVWSEEVKIYCML